MLLKGKRILLTGGAGGIGRLVCQNLINEGAELIVITQRNRLSFSARLVTANLANSADLARVCDIVAVEKPDILVNLAGIQHFGKFEDESLSHIQNGFAVNLIAPVALAAAAIPHMRRRGSGQIVNMGSIMGSIGCANFVTYSSAKGGMHRFSEALRRELAGSGVQVTYIAPRAVATGMTTDGVRRYAKATKMAIDEPVNVAAKIVTAIRLRRKEVYFGIPESIFVRVNAILPRVIDAAVAKSDRNAAHLISPDLTSAT